MTPSSKLKLFQFIVCILFNRVGLAVPPDAGQIARQQEQLNASPTRSLPVEESQEPELQPPNANEISILVKQIEISGGDTLESREVLQSLVVDAIGQRLGFAQLKQLTDRISQHLKTKGWLLAKVYLPKQDVTDGIVQINIVLGQLEADEQGRRIDIQREPGSRIGDKVVEERMRYVISDGTLRGDYLERALLLLNDLPGIHARSTMEKGKQSGTSRLGVNIKEDGLLKGSFSVDDFGSRYTGPWRGSLSINLNDLLGLGDQLTVSGSGAENLGQGRFGYSWPLGYSGLLANAYYSYLQYSIGQELKSSGSWGSAQYAGGGLSYPLLRTRAFSIWATADYTHKILADFAATNQTGNKRIDSGVFGFNGQKLDGFFGGGLNQFSYTTTVGQVDLSDIGADFSTDKNSARTQGIYDKHNFSLNRLQKLTENLSFYIAANGQFAGKNLASAEKFILGGPTSIRAYPTGEASGDSGWLTNVELRYDLPMQTPLGNLQFVGFFDTGHITLHKQRWPGDVTSASGRNEFSLSGSGIGVNLSRGSNFAIRTSWAHTIGSHWARNASGNDSDGLQDTQRFWLQSMIYF